MLEWNRMEMQGGSTPSSPMRVRRKARRGAAERVTWQILGVLIRRQGVFLFAPVVYISGMVLYMGSVSFDVVPLIRHRPAPGSVYRSPLLFERLRPFLLSPDADDAFPSLSRQSSQHPHRWYPCLASSNQSQSQQTSSGFLLIEANGGLNQQRTSICNAVAVAAFLNATLVIPNFHFHSVWRDPSKFGDIYDEEHFIAAVSGVVRVVREVPGYVMERFDHQMTNVFNFKIKAGAPIRHYRDHVLPKLLEEKVIRISPFANRLAADAPAAVQRARCLANYEALRFSKGIAEMGERVVRRMRERSSSSKGVGGGYVAVHLRFEEDMVAFSCCVFEGSAEEEGRMAAARERGWRGKFTKAGKVINPALVRVNGKCPLTPLEVGLMLRGMGFARSTFIYLAAGPIYEANATMAPLRDMFPNLVTKDDLASKEELAPFAPFSSRMAAIDYTVCLHSEVFVTTQGGNFPQLLTGHRRYLFHGHSNTIKPDKRKLALIFDNPNITWKAFKRQMVSLRAHSASKGFELKRPNDSIYSYPCPDCMCRNDSKT